MSVTRFPLDLHSEWSSQHNEYSPWQARPMYKNLHTSSSRTHGVCHASALYKTRALLSDPSYPRVTASTWTDSSADFESETALHSTTLSYSAAQPRRKWQRSRPFNKNAKKQAHAEKKKEHSLDTSKPSNSLHQSPFPRVSHNCPLRSSSLSPRPLPYPP
jgi:hypothetical protein